MPAIPDTVDIACPRCHNPIVCTLDVTTAPPKPGGARVIASASVPDLADRFNEHYHAAGHVDTVHTKIPDYRQTAHS